MALTKKSPYVAASHRVTGLMLANNTGIGTLFRRMLDQYDRLRKRNAFLEQYKKESMFENGLEEFDESRSAVQDLINEYAACEKSDYIVRWEIQTIDKIMSDSCASSELLRLVKVRRHSSDCLGVNWAHRSRKVHRLYCIWVSGYGTCVPLYSG